ncbi:MAG: DUF5666 domain-containing protein [Chromatiales bacterium]
MIVNQSIHGTTAATEFERNGELVAGQEDFRVGDVVVIEWDSDDDGATREAIRVTYQRELFGEVTANPDEANGTVGVLGQTVRADATTIFDEFDPNFPPLPGEIFPQDLNAGDCVEVTGFRDASGNLFATRIEFKGNTCPVGESVELKGIVTDVSGLPDQIIVSGTPVDISSAIITPSGATPAFEDFVEVEGDFTGGVLEADTVEIRDDDLSGLEDDDADVEGIIAGLSGANPIFSFTVSGIPVSTDSGTVYEGGDVTNLANDVRVEAEGSFSGGVLRAEKIEFKLDGSIRMETVVLDANGTTGEVTLRYGNNDTLLVLTDPLVTQLRDKTDTFVPFGVGDLRPGDYVEIAAFIDGTDIVASKLELEDLATNADTDRVLQGPITEITGSPPTSIEILNLAGIIGAGVTIPTEDLTDCEDAAGDPVVPCEDLLVTLQLGDIVKAQGDENVTTGFITWDELELEN